MKKLKATTLKKRVTLYMAMAMAFLIVLIITISASVQGYRANMQEVNYSTQIHLGVEHVIKRYIKDYSYRAKRMLTDPSVAKMMREKDREGLYKLFKPRWDLMLEEEENLKIMHFHLADGSSFLRMHRADKFGDSLSEVRPMIEEIHSSRKSIHGYETGKNGTVYRVVEPIFDADGEYVGAFEIGVNPKFILRVIEDINGFSGMMFIKESSLFLYSTPSDKLIDGYRLQSELKPPLGEIYEKMKTSGKLENSTHVSIGNKNYRTHLFILNSFSGESKVKIMFFQDVSEFGLFRGVFLLFILTSMAVVLALLVWFVYRRIGLYEKDVSGVYEEQIERLNESEKRFATLYEKAPEAYQALDADGNVLMINAKWSEDLGYAKEEAIGKNFSVFLADGFREKFKENFPKFKAAGGVTGIEFDMLRKDGKTISVSFNGKIVNNEEGELLQTHCIFTNVTEQKIAQEKMAFNEEYMRSVFDVISDIMITSNGSEIDRVNPAMLEFFSYETIEEFKADHDCICDYFIQSDGYVTSEIDGQDWLGFILSHPEDVHKVSMLKDGKYRHFIVKAHYIHLDEKRRSVVIFRDVTEMEEISERLSYAVNGTNDGLWDWNVRENVVYFSPRWKEMLGYEDVELSNEFKTWELLVHPDDLKQSLAKIQRAIDDSSVEYHNTFRLRHKDGSWVWILARGQALFDKNKNAVRMVGFHTDVSAQKELELQLIENEKIYFDFFEHTKSANIMYSTDDEGATFRIKALNKLVEEIEGVKREDVIGKRIDEIFEGVEEFGLLDVFKEVYKTGIAKRMPISMYEDEKVKGWRENYVFKLLNGDVVASYEDKTQEKILDLLLKNTINSLENLIFVKDSEFKYLECNGAFEKFIGYSREELIGYDDYEFFPKELADIFRGKDQEIFDSRARTTSLEWTTFADGREVYLYTIISPLYSEDGEVIGLVGNAVDLTQQKKLEDDLRASKEQFEKFMENIPANILIKDSEGKILYVNSGAEKFFGRRDLIGKGAKDLLPPLQAQEVDVFDKKAIAQGQNEEIINIPNVDGEIEVHRDLTFRIDDEEHPRLGIISLNITKEYLLSQELEKEEQKAKELGKILENSINEVYIFSQEDFKFFYVNEAALKNIGYSLKEILDLTPAEIKPNVSKDELIELIEPLRAQETDKIFFTTRHQRKDKTTYPIETYLQSIIYEGAEAYVAIVIDVSEREKIEQRLHDQEEIMLAQSRHAAMGEMISMIAHQWRQPISVIAMDANNVLVDIELESVETESLKSDVNDIIEQTKHLSQTIDDFRNFFKPNKIREEVLVADVFRDAYSVIEKSLLNNNVEVENIFDSTFKVSIFSRELLQVFVNVLKNAKEALEEHRAEDRKITNRISEDEDSVVVSICDNAGGIAEDIMDKIFEPYFSTKDEKNGTGLGLYMSKTIVEKHLFGELNVKNTQDGVCFLIKIPKGGGDVE